MIFISCFLTFYCSGQNPYSLFQIHNVLNYSCWILNSSPSTMNQRKSMLQALLTHIRLTKEYVTDLRPIFQFILSIKHNINGVISA